MIKTIILNNNSKRKDIVSPTPFSRVKLLSFYHTVDEIPDPASFVFEWKLKQGRKTISQYINYNIKSKPLPDSQWHQNDLLKKLRACYPTDELFHFFSVRLFRPFLSEKSAIIINIEFNT